MTQGTSARLRLRGGDLGARLIWPPGTPTGMLVLLAGPEPEGERVGRELADTLGVVALSVRCRSVADGVIAVGWAADHAAELGADGARVLLAGGNAEAVAACAHAEGWPEVVVIDLTPR